jgi:hypothetical protein
MAEWSKDHVAAIGPLTSNSGLITVTWLKWRPGEATRGKRETAGWDGQGVGIWQTGTSKVVAPACVG